MTQDIATSGAIIPSWMQKMVTNGNGGEMLGSTIDSNGFVYVCGNYLAANPFTFADVTLPAGVSASLRVGFYAKFSSSGTLQWIKTVKSFNSYVRCEKIRVDENHLYIVGSYVTTQPIPLENSLSLPISVGIDGFMISASKSDGSAIWTNRIGGGNNDTQMGIALDSSNVYFTGSYSQAITFNASVSLPSVVGAFDGCIIAYRKSDGVALWAKRIPGTGGEIAYSVTEYDTYIYVASHYIASSAITLQVSPEIILPITKIANGNRVSAPLLLKLQKSDGLIVWAKYFETDRDLSVAFTVAADTTGVYLGGQYCLNAPFDLGNNVILPKSLSNIANANTAYVIKYSHSGIPQWVRTINTSVGYNTVITLTTADNYLYIGGTYFTSSTGPASFNSLVSLPQNSSRSAFIFCCTTDGFPIWTDILNNSFNTTTNDIVKSTDGIVVACSHAGYGATIGNGVIPPNTGMTASPMVVKYLVQNPVISPANVATVLTNATAAANNAAALDSIKTIISQITSANIVQKVADTSTAAVIGRISEVPKVAGATPIIASTDNTVAIKAFSPTSADVVGVALTVANVTDPVAISAAVPSDVPITQLTKVAVRKLDSVGNIIESVIGNTSTYDEITISVSLNNSGVFAFVHTSSSGVQTLLTANINLNTATLNQPVALSGAASSTITVISRTATDAVLKYFGPFSDLNSIGDPGGGSFVQQDGQVVYTTGPVPCFIAGTMILTPNGYKPVETLSVGDYVTTADGRNVVAKIYQRKITYATNANAPYRIPAATFGKYQPNEITLSPLHAIQIKKGLWEIPQEAAKRYSGIKQVSLGKPITYFHIETPHYFRDNLVANGCIVESFGLNAKKYIPANVTVYKFSEHLGGYTRYSPSSASVVKSS